MQRGKTKNYSVENVEFKNNNLDVWIYSFLLYSRIFYVGDAVT